MVGHKFRELMVVKLLHILLLNTTAVAFKVLRFGSYAPMPAPSPPFKTILERVLWNGPQSCRCITPDFIKCHQSAFLSIFPLSWGKEKGHWRLDLVNRQGVPTQLFV